MKITIADTGKGFVESAMVFFGDKVEYHCGNIMDVQAEAVVSPANSFGYMDGGIDLVYLENMGWDIQDMARNIAAKQQFGEILVGQAELVEIPGRHFSKLIMAPTMRLPRRIFNFDDVFIATRAAMQTAKDNNIQSLVIPGMGTGCGMVPYHIAAKLMYDAFNVVFQQKEYSL
jgi:O-acetyl-ADP-ribose deacetylase (regulator of RNase III)